MTLLVAFLLGYFSNQIMMNMCDDNLVEGSDTNETFWQKYWWIKWIIVWLGVPTLFMLVWACVRFSQGKPILSNEGNNLVRRSQVPLPNPEAP
jgi:hypothetical protein